MISNRVSPLIQRTFRSRNVPKPVESVRDVAAVFDASTTAPSREHNARWLSTSTTADSATTTTSPAVNLYQYKICPFSNIAKAVLTYQQIPFHSIEVNPLTKAELKFSKDYRKVPIVTQQQQQDESLPELQQWNGTEEILEHFAAANSSNNNDDNDFATSESSLKWQDFARNKLAPLLYPNLCNSLSSSFRAFDYVHQSSNNFTTMQKYSIQYVGALAMYFAASKIKQKYQLDDVRIALDEALMELEEGLQQSKSSSSILLNSNENPHLGDLAVFGVLKGLDGLPILDDCVLQEERYPNITQWYAAMNEQVEVKRLKNGL